MPAASWNLRNVTGLALNVGGELSFINHIRRPLTRVTKMRLVKHVANALPQKHAVDLLIQPHSLWAIRKSRVAP